MRKSLAFILLAFASLLVEGGCTLSFAAEVANTEEFASPESAQPQPSQRMMHRTQQANIEEKQKTDSEKDQVQDEDTVQGQVEAVPNPSQRNMRQQIRDAQRNQAPITVNP